MFGKREKQQGKDSYIMLIFCRQRRDLMEPIWVSENVPEHPVGEYKANTGDLYDIEVIMTNPLDLGWKIRRSRTNWENDCDLNSDSAPPLFRHLSISVQRFGSWSLVKISPES